MVKPISSAGVLGVCAALALGEAAGFVAGPFGWLWLYAVAAALCTVFFGYAFSIKGWKYVAIFLAGFSLALYTENSRYEALDTIESSNGPFTAELKVETPPINRFGRVSFNSSWRGIDLQVRFKDDTQTPSPGEIWKCTGWVERKDRSFRGRRRMYISGVHSSAQRIYSPSSISPVKILHFVRDKMLNASKVGVLEDYLLTYGINKAMIFGDRSGLEKTTRKTFATAGTTHFFAISGLHVGVVLGLILLFLRLCKCPFDFSGVFAVPAIWFYAFLALSSPSAMRASSMATFYLMGPFFMRRSDALVAWAQTFVIFHIFCPSMLFDIGSVLSFTVMLGILVSDRFAVSLGWSRKKRAILVFVAAWAFGAPVAAYVFGQITPGGLVATLLLMPLAGTSVILGFIGSIIGCFSLQVAAHINNAAILSTEAMRGISWAVASIPWANIEVEQWGLFDCISWYLLIVLLPTLVYLRAKRKEQFWS